MKTGLVVMFLSVCACAGATMKLQPSVEPDFADPFLIFLAQQARNGEDYNITINPASGSVSLTGGGIKTDSTHAATAEKIQKNILSRKEFKGSDGRLNFRTMTFYGFTACWKKDLENLSYEKFAELTRYDQPFINRSVFLWREIMGFGGRGRYINEVR